MLTVYRRDNGHLVPNQPGDCEGAFWMDLYQPSREEEQRVEQHLGIEVPTREEMREVESSSALYREREATFVTVRVVQRDTALQPRLVSITLVITGSVFLTIRYDEPKSFRQFVSRARKENSVFNSPSSAMLCLLETIVDRAADILEEIGEKLDPISLEIFSQNAGSMKTIAAADLGRVLKKIGENGDLTSRVRESLHSVKRAVPFLGMNRAESEEVRTRLKTLSRDVQSLLEHDNFLQTQIQFLLDSNLGLISIQQNAIMKSLSVAAVVFLPPTLVGSIYGMNFEHLPELHWRYGYFYALALMLASSLGPFLYFRAKRWL